MKVFASALLAMGAAAMRLAALNESAAVSTRDQEIAGQDDNGHPVNAAGQRVFPHAAPDCTTYAADADAAKATYPDAATFVAVLDGDDSGTIDEKEAWSAIYCFVEWGALTEPQGWAAFDGFQKAYGPGGAAPNAEIAAIL